jgi:hypothetical protein
MRASFRSNGADIQTNFLFSTMFVSFRQSWAYMVNDDPSRISL